MADTDSPIPTPAITEELLQELRRLLEAATPGEWRVGSRYYPYDEGNIISCGTNERDTETVFMGEPIDGYNPPLSGRDEDKAFIVAFRNAAPSLLAAAARLKETESRCEALRQEQILHHDHGEESCFCCAGQWTHGAAERHAPDCVARPLPESQR